jgi:hypothetical protein
MLTSFFNLTFLFTLKLSRLTSLLPPTSLSLSLTCPFNTNTMNTEAVQAVLIKHNISGYNTRLFKAPSPDAPSKVRTSRLCDCLCSDDVEGCSSDRLSSDEVGGGGLQGVTQAAKKKKKF